MIKKIGIVILVIQIFGCNSTETAKNEEKQTNSEAVKEIADKQIDEREIEKNNSIPNKNEKEIHKPKKIKNPPVNNFGIPEDSVITASQDNKKIVADYKSLIEEMSKFLDDESKIESYAKTPDSDILVSVPNDDQWPEATEIAYNILRDQNGKITYLGEFPVSQSGDWWLAYRYFFNDDGETIIFLRESNFFNSECTGGVAKELSKYFFNSDFKLIAKEYDLKDTEGNDLRDKLCFLNYHYDYEIKCCLKDLIDKLKIEK